MKETDQIARAVLDIFRQQRKLANGGKDKFGSWHHKLSQALLDPIAALYLKGAKKGKATVDDMESVASAAKERAMYVARLVNDTSGEWLRDGREPNVVFSPERAVQIAETETTNAVNFGKAIPVQARGGKLRWKVGKAPCKFCSRLNGKVVKAGKPFGKTPDGQPIFAPPVHPHCYCSVEEV